MNKNLYQETLEAIGRLGMTLSDVGWVGSYDGEYAISWDEFALIASKTDYDSGYGGQEIANDLVVVFKDRSWLERGEYDGSEWWEHRRPPIRTYSLTFDRVDCNSSTRRPELMWDTLKAMNTEEDDE